MAPLGWKQLLKGWPWFRGSGSYPIAAYSEFLPPPRLGRKPYGEPEPLPFADGDQWGWQVSEYEEAREFRPGLARIAQEIVGSLYRLGSGQPTHSVSRGTLGDNPYWPETLAHAAGRLEHERYVVLLPLALSRTQDDKGRVHWTLFGNSEQGPAQAFWRGFFTAPNQELPEEKALGFFRRLLQTVYEVPEAKLADLRRAGLRILPAQDDPAFPFWREEPLPSWTKPLLWGKGQSVSAVKYLLTFRPFSQLPAAVQKAYLAGTLHLWPFPGSLAFWGAAAYRRLHQELSLAVQVPLLYTVGRHEGWPGLRIPQCGWLHEASPNKSGPAPHGPVRNTFKRTHRWARVLRSDDELALTEREDKTTHVLFSAHPDDLGLYYKPMALNAQVWTHDYRPLLDGPRATPADLEHATHTLRQGGQFGYRFQYPPMRVGRHNVYWHRPLAAYWDARTGQAALLPDAPLGYLTAYDAEKPDLAQPVELWPRLLQREPYVIAMEMIDHAHTHACYQIALNVRKLLDTRQLLGERPLSRSLARALLTITKHESLDDWLQQLPNKSADPERGQRLVEVLRHGLEAAPAPALEPITYADTSRRSFEMAYWKTIAYLAEGKYLTKNNADCVRDPVTQKHLGHLNRDLDSLGDYLLAYYRKAVKEARMTGKALVGDLPFVWRTEFNYDWMGGWLNNQEGRSQERDLIVVIPGRDRSRAVIMADHYDTAYMEDRYEPQRGGDGARLAASGADDNHSATAAMMLAAPLFLKLARSGKLACDVWLVHLTGEEFPADCLGARHLAQWLVEGTLRMRLPDGQDHDLSGTQVVGVYVSDMIAHNNDRERDIFQISPGTGSASMWLANVAHVATELWNAGTVQWNRRPSRRGRGRGRRSPRGSAIPPIAEHLALHGEVRPPYDPRCTLYNTDGQIFSDAGVPVVLFMENYDINRTGYHDTHDTMENIDLDYGAALAAITIETVAQAASIPRTVSPRTGSPRTAVSGRGGK
jgi:hypothetical protein